MSRNAGIILIAILFSRLFGLVREKMLAIYLGNSLYADAFKAAMRIPNLLQNLLGDGVISSSFIPVYSRLIKTDSTNNAAALARKVGAMMLILLLILTVLGTIFKATLVDLIAPGFNGEVEELTNNLLYLLFPACALFAFSGWSLGILNSRHKFFIPYFSPVIWSSSVIVALLCSNPGEKNLVWSAGLGVLVGALFQFLFQFIFTIQYLKYTPTDSGVLYNKLEVETNLIEVKKNLVPSVLSRGVAQISAYIDSILSSYTPIGGVSTLSYAQSIYFLPMSLFAASISSSELPILSTLSKEDFDQRILAIIKSLGFFIVPAAICYLILGDLVVKILLEGGKFTPQDTKYTWAVLAVMSLGLIPSSLSRILTTGLFARGRTKETFKITCYRLLTSFLVSLIFFRLTGDGQTKWSLLGIAAGSVFGSWLEIAFLLKKLELSFILVFKNVLYLALIASSCCIVSRIFSETVGPFFGLALFGLKYLSVQLYLKNETALKFKNKFKSLIKTKRI